MKKGAEAFRSIGEVARLVGVAPHVLRYWETQFPQLKPMKRPDGRRYYRPEDLRLAAGLCEILREEGLTIRGARKLMARDRGESIRARGAARLNGIIPAVTEPDMPARNGPDMVPGVDRPSLPDHRAVAPTPQKPDQIPDPIFEATDMPSHPPRSRHRRRRHIEEDGNGALPLFPDLSSPPMGGPVWLARMIQLSAALRQRDERAPHPGLHSAARRLHDAILNRD